MFNKKISDISIGKYVLISVITIVVTIWIFGWFARMAAKRKDDLAASAGQEKKATTSVGPNNKPTIAYR